MKLGLSGHLTRAFINSPLTPLLLLAALVVGRTGARSRCRARRSRRSACRWSTSWSTANGYKAGDAIELITRPLEDIVKGINGVEHVYSQTQDDRVVVTARFFVGTDEDTAVLRIHEKIRANIADLPKGIPEPLIIGRGINDVAIVVLTLAAKPGHAERWTDNGLFQIAEELQHELIKVENVGDELYRRRQPQPDPRRARSRAPAALRHHAQPARRQARPTPTAPSWSAPSASAASRSPSLAGQTLQGVPDIGLLLLTSRDGRPVYVKDVADVVVGAAEPERRAWTLTRGAAGELERRPAVTIAFAKRKGANAVSRRRRGHAAARDRQGPHRSRRRRGRR